MSRITWREFRHDVGLVWPRHGWFERHFLIALGAGALAVGAMAATGWFLPSRLPGVRDMAVMLLVAPLAEEFVFRGLIQGTLRLDARWRRHHLSISRANLEAALLFTALHLLHRPAWAAMSVFVPALVFGHLRERTGSLGPAMLLHAAYNALFLLALMWHVA